MALLSGATSPLSPPEALMSALAPTLSLKVVYRGELAQEEDTRKVALRRPAVLQALVEAIREKFADVLEGQPFQMRYTDAEGDLMTLSDQADLQEFLRQGAGGVKPCPSTPCSQPSGASAGPTAPKLYITKRAMVTPPPGGASPLTPGVSAPPQGLSPAMLWSALAATTLSPAPTQPS
eukprot:RCo047148